MSSDKLAELEAALKKQAGGAAALIELAWHLRQRDRHRAVSVCREVAALFCQLDEAEALLSAKLLSPKEREILQLLACNDANKEIANALEVGDETIKWHLKKIHTKREAGSRKHAVTRARTPGVIGFSSYETRLSAWWRDPNSTVFRERRSAPS